MTGDRGQGIFSVAHALKETSGTLLLFIDLHSRGATP